MDPTQLKQGVIVRGPALPEPIEVLLVETFGDMVKIVGAGKRTGRVHQRLPPAQVADLEASIARVDPLPHQLEAVCDYFLRLQRPFRAAASFLPWWVSTANRGGPAKRCCGQHNAFPTRRLIRSSIHFA